MLEKKQNETAYKPSFGPHAVYSVKKNLILGGRGKTVLGPCQRCINTNCLYSSCERQIIKNNGRVLRFNVACFIYYHQVPDNLAC